jgi:pilus assembly protein Flp/PilA
MTGIMVKFKEFLVSEEGATATEYAVMLALIIIVAIVAIGALGNKVNDTFTNISNAMP